MFHFVYGDARPQAINKRLFEHVISANNSCPQVIKMDVCYYRSQRCVPLSVPGYSRREVVLGVMPAIKDFRFESKSVSISLAYHAVAETKRRLHS